MSKVFKVSKAGFYDTYGIILDGYIDAPNKREAKEAVDALNATLAAVVLKQERRVAKKKASKK